MDLSKRVPLSGQENISEGKNRKSSQKSLERVVLRTLQPYSSGRQHIPSYAAATEIPSSKNKLAGRKTAAVTDVSRGRVQMKNQEVQTDIIEAHDYEICTSEEPPLAYWKVLAEQRRHALSETLQENEELHSENIMLRKKIAELERRMESKEYFAMMYQIACKDSAEGN